MDPQTHFLKYPKLCMNLVGIMGPKLSNTWFSYVYRTWAIFLQGCFLIFFLSLIVGMGTVRDLLRNNMSFFWTFLIVAVKLVLAQTATMEKVIDDMFKLEGGIDKDDEGANRKYSTQSRYNSKIFCVLAFIYFGSLWQFCWLLRNKKTQFLTAWLPFDSTNYYTLTFVFQIVSSIIITFYNLTFDTLFSAIILFPSMLLNILGHKFRHFEDYCKKQAGLPKLVLRQLIMEHQAIIKYVEELDSSLKWFFFVDFLVKSYHLSLMIISLMTVADGMNTTLIFQFSHLAYWSMQSWCMYYHGNELIVDSLNISNRIVESNWYEHDLVVKKMLLIIMLRSRKPLELHVGVFQALSNEILVKFFKAGYSVLAWSVRS